ncbi:MAG TPA: alpha/beta fold hydrolase [Taishania sp.]|nr:alpha/beta fold hydrolase [Taishania sp.]
MLEIKSSYLQSSSLDDELHKLAFTLFVPKETQIRGTVLILHGMQEHSGRYADFAKFLAENGFAVVTYDHLGHGKTAEINKKFGYFYKKDPMNQVVLDAENMAAYLEHKYPTVPHFVLGHSMGSFITRCLLQVAQQRFDGAIIVGTGGPKAGIGFAKAWFALKNKLAPEKQDQFVNKLFVKINNVKFKNEPSHHGTNWLSKSIENRDEFLKDPLCGIPFTNNGFYTLLSVVERATTKNWAKDIIRKFPFLFVSGEDDPIGDFGKGVKITYQQLVNKGFQDVSLKLYPKMRHEILNEINKDEVYNDILNWLNQRVQPN